MPIEQSQHTESSRRFHGERIALELIERLNRPKQDGSLATIRKALALCQEMYQLREKLSAELAVRRKSPPPSLDALLALHVKMYALLKPFVSRPEIIFSGSSRSPGEPDFYLFWHLDESSPFYKLRIRGETQPHSLFLRCVEADIVRRIVRCDCGTYFYQRFSHQRFCSASCRVKANQNTEAAREYRRSKQREYYRLHRTKNTK